MNAVLRVLLVASALAALSATARADDLAPPWFRGLPHSVTAKFDLLGPVPGPPVVFMTGPGSVYPLAPLPPAVFAPTTLPTGELLYPIALPNFIDNEPIKHVRIQYSWFGSLTGFPGDASATILPSPGGIVTLVGSSPTMPIPGTGIYHRWDDFTIRPNPQSERFEVVFRLADPRWVVIDTISIPEPATVVLVGLAAALGWVGRRD